MAHSDPIVVAERTCKKHGPYKMLPHSWICPQCEAEMQAEQEERWRRERIAKQLQNCAIPPRFAGKMLADFIADTPKRKAAKQDVIEHLEGGSGWALTLVGRPGTGKTLLSCAALRELILQDFSGRYLTQREAVRMLRDTWHRDSEVTETQMLNRLAGYDVLVLDEVGAGLGSDAERAQFFELVDLRYRNMRMTIFVSNLNAAGLREYCGERVYDRMREEGTWVPFDWDSSRGKAPASATKEKSS